MIKALIAAAVVVLVGCGCAANGAVYWDRGDSQDGGPPATWPCQATG